MLFVILISISLLIILLLKQYLRYKTQLARILVTAFYSFGFGIYFECFRALSFIFFEHHIDPFINKFLFIISTFLILFGIFTAFQALLIFNRQSGHEIPKESFIKYSYLATIAVISIFNIFMAIEIYSPELGYIYQLHPILIIATIAVQILLLIFVIARTRTYLREITNKKLVFQLVLFLSFFTALSVERCFSLVYFLLLPNPFYIYIIDLSILAFFLVIGFILLLKNPVFLEAISTYFCVKSIHILRKKGGQVVFRHDFQQTDRSDLVPDQLLLGGFIYAVTSGLEATLKVSGKMEEIKVGDITILFKHGKYVLGIEFVTENTPTLHLKLLQFMQKFESYYSPVLEDWTGDLSQFDSKMIQTWAYEIFR